MTEQQYFSAPFWADRFHFCAIRAYVEAMAEGRNMDSGYVRKLAYRYYEEN
jgi:hypothetical protein